MASIDKRTGRARPTGSDRATPSDVGAAPSNDMADMLGGGPESIPPHTPDPAFTIGGGLADAQALGDPRASSTADDVADDRSVARQPTQRTAGDDQPGAGRSERRRSHR